MKTLMILTASLWMQVSQAAYVTIDRLRADAKSMVMASGINNDPDRCSFHIEDSAGDLKLIIISGDPNNSMAMVVSKDADIELFPITDDDTYKMDYRIHGVGRADFGQTVGGPSVTLHLGDKAQFCSAFGR